MRVPVVVVLHSGPMVQPSVEKLGFLSLWWCISSSWLFTIAKCEKEDPVLRFHGTETKTKHLLQIFCYHALMKHGLYVCLIITNKKTALNNKFNPAMQDKFPVRLFVFSIQIKYCIFISCYVSPSPYLAVPAGGISHSWKPAQVTDRSGQSRFIQYPIMPRRRDSSRIDSMCCFVCLCVSLSPFLIFSALTAKCWLPNL